MKEAYMAIDAHARHCVLGIMDESGQYLDQWRFATTESELVRHVTAVRAAHRRVAIEEGPLAYWIAQTLQPHIAEVFICDPRENALIGHNPRKHDEADTRQLCRLLRLGELKRVYHPADDARAVFKAAAQHYLDLRTEQARLKHKIKAKFRSWGVIITDTMKLYSPKRRAAYLARVPCDAVREQLRRLYAVLDAAVTAKRQALRALVALGGRYPEIERMQQVPGVGVVGAHVFDAYIQTPDRLAGKRQLWRYCQLAVSERSSDGKPLGFARLDRAGNSTLKALSYFAWLGSLRTRQPNAVRDYYEACLARTHDKVHARLNTQRKLLATLLALWRRKENFDPARFHATP
jgi:transposase